LTESWDGTHSQDHFMLGHIMEWFYGELAGIKCGPDSIGFKKIVIKPTPVGNITWATAAYYCPYGKIKTAWKLGDGKFTLDVIIPPGATATVYLPGDNKTPITESGADIAQAKSVKLSQCDAGYTQLEIASGEYHFQSIMPSQRSPISVNSGAN
jgi:alpha-L-rhamnosidase